MYTFKRTQLDTEAVSQAEEKPSALAHIAYLYPSRYFRQYLFYDQESNRTCWLPEGHNA